MVAVTSRSAALAAAVTLVACDGAAPVATADATVTSPDLPSVDASPFDTPADLVADVALSPCPSLGALPAWASRDTGGRVTARAASVQLQVELYADAVARLRYVPTDATPSARPSWALAATPTPDTTLRAGSLGDALVVCSDALRVDVTAALRVTVRDAQGTVLLEDGADGGWREGPVVQRVAHAGERYLGLGEKTGPLDHRGQRLTFWNTDAYSAMHGGWAPGTDPLYASVPFVLGLRAGTAYGVLTDNTHRLDIDLARAAPDAWTVRAAGGTIDQYILAGPTPANVLRRYTALTGRIPLPPRWALGFHQSRWGYAPASRVEALAGEFRARRIPADGLWLDIQHMRGFRSFTFDPSTFADPAGLTARLAARGFKLTVIEDPGLKLDTTWNVYTDGLTRDVFLHGPDGVVATGAAWPGTAVFPDFTLPRARAWWGQQVGSVVALGVRGVWLDVNEPTTFPEGGGGMTLPDATRADGEGFATTMAEAHNVYALGEARATWEAMRAAAPTRRPFVLTRAGYAGSQRYGAMWTGDAPSAWWSLRQQLPMLLGMGLSGLAFVGSDVGGYSGHATPELFARWMSLGVVSPFFRAHVTQGVNDQEPWAFGQEVEDISRAFLQERYRLLPYVYSLFDEARRSGAPILRALAYEMPGEAAVEAVDDEAMLGPWILAAPVLDEGATRRRVTLPAGRWYELHSGAAYDGPATLELDVTLAALPLYVREGAILPRGPVRQSTDDDTRGPLTLDVYPTRGVSRFTRYDDEGDGFAFERNGHARVAYSLEGTATGATLRAAPQEGTWHAAGQRLEVRVHRVDHLPSSVTLSGRALAMQADVDALARAGEGWAWDADDLSLVVAFDDRDGFELDCRYDPTLTALRPPVRVPITVRLPDATPRMSNIHIASSASGWMHVPIAWVDGAASATGFITVPRGEWFFYKYSRGGWDTVEKWQGCVEATNRYGFGAAHPPRSDSVATWADWCRP